MTEELHFRLKSLATYGGFHKWGYPQMDALFHGKSHCYHCSKWMMTRGTQIFDGTPPLFCYHENDQSCINFPFSLACTAKRRGCHVLREQTGGDPEDLRRLFSVFLCDKCWEQPPINLLVDHRHPFRNDSLPQLNVSF